MENLQTELTTEREIAINEVKNAAAAVLTMGLLIGMADPLLAQGAQQQEQRRQHLVEPGMGQPWGGMMQQGPQGMMGQGQSPGMMGQMPGGGPMGPGVPDPWHDMGPGPMGEGQAPGGMGPGAMGQGGMWHIGPHMMSPDEMQEMMEHMGAMMDRGMPMQPGMMAPGMGPGMMDQHTGPGMGGWSGVEGRRVVPMMQLSPDDVRGYFERHLAMLGNERLKVGSVEALDDDTITAEIVTVDDSLVERFEVDRRTGVISAAG